MPDRELNYREDPNFHNEQEVTPKERAQIERYEKELHDKLELENQKEERWNLEEPK